MIRVWKKDFDKKQGNYFNEKINGGGDSICSMLDLPFSFRLKSAFFIIFVFSLQLCISASSVLNEIYKDLNWPLDLWCRKRPLCRNHCPSLGLFWSFPSAGFEPTTSLSYHCGYSLAVNVKDDWFKHGVLLFWLWIQTHLF